MTQRNNFLLIVKQYQGIEYNTLLNRVAPEYGSINSARAALSRTVKDLTALGFLHRQGSKLYVTDKGMYEINSEMKNKLLLRLNSAVNSKNQVSEIDSIVKMLQTLIERSKADNDLLKAARSSSNFVISDLEELRKNTEQKVNQLNYLSKILLNQINSLKKLNFNDSKEFNLNAETIPLLHLMLEQQQSEHIWVECSNKKFMENANIQLQAKQENNSLLLDKNQLKNLILQVLEFPQTEKNRVKIFLPSIQIQIENPKAYLTAPFKNLKEIK
ncbi:MAG: hypothetical protein JW772_05625 [Candidatus Diapherotrites archaeon]|nr:hypothetical protein [Candidatus Diapherotrites archaeon]